MKIKKIIENFEDTKLSSIEFDIEINETPKKINCIYIIGSDDSAMSELIGDTNDDKRKRAMIDLNAKVLEQVASITEIENKKEKIKEKIKETKEGDIKNYK